MWLLKAIYVIVNYLLMTWFPYCSCRLGRQKTLFFEYLPRKHEKQE